MDNVSHSEIGGLCLIYSRSKNRWFVGQIIKIFIDSNTNSEWLIVKYGKSKKKKIQRNCDAILPYIDLNDSKMVDMRTSLNIGSICKIFNESDKNWYFAKVTKTFTHPEAGQWLTVKYHIKTVPKTSNIQPYSNILEPINFSLNELILTDNKHYILPRNKALKFDNVNISNCVLSLTDQGILSIESDGNITIENCIIDLSGKADDIVNNYAYYDMTRDINQVYVGRGSAGWPTVNGGSALRLCCNQLKIKNTKINISGTAENGSMLLICNELITDDQSVIYGQGKGGRIVIKMNNFLSNRKQSILIHGYWRQMQMNTLIIDDVCNLCNLFLIRDEWVENINLNVCDYYSTINGLSENIQIYMVDCEWNKRMSDRKHDYMVYHRQPYKYTDKYLQKQDLRVIYEHHKDLIIEPVTTGYKMPKHPSKIPHDLWNL